VLGWLVVDGELPESVLGQLLAALTAWEPLMGGVAVSTRTGPRMPSRWGQIRLTGPAGSCLRSSRSLSSDCDVADLLEAQWWRRAEQAESVCWHDRVALVEVCGRLGLALAEMRGRRRGSHRRPGVGRPLLCQRVLGRPRLGVGAGG
jgi:hypothetical protein